MNPIAIFLVVGLVIAQLSLPKKIGFLPLIIAACTFGNVELLPEITPSRLLILMGLIRAVSKGLLVNRLNSKLDGLFLCFAVVALVSTLGHKADPWIPSPFNARVGLILNVLGAYFYGRAYFPDLSAFKLYAFCLPLVLLPLSLGMTVEQKTGRNFYYTLGASSPSAAVREDKVRAKGPFRHPILAGTAGATALPLIYLLWRMRERKRAICGFLVCLAIVLASASSGPMAAMGVGLFAMLFWRWREHLRYVLWGAVGFACFYVLYSGRGPWYLMASIDLVGGSTGWHRARLIDQGYKYISEWWLWGTDYTRHWMASGVSWSPNHVDMTNYYLHLGVIGGMPLMLTLVAILVSAFRMLGRRMRELRAVDSVDEIALWCAGTSLATHTISFVSISYFDQMYVIFYILLGAIPGLVSTPALGQHPAAPHSGSARVKEAEAVEARPLRFYS